MKITATLAAVALLIGTATLHTSDRLNLRVSPKVSRAPADLFVYVSIERQADNRLLVVNAESDDFFRSSTAQLDGEESARVKVFNFRSLPSGSYDVAAYLIGPMGKTIEVARSTIVVM